MIALLTKVLLLAVCWSVVFCWGWKGASKLKPLFTFLAMLVPALGITYFISRLGIDSAPPQAIWIAILVGLVVPIWFFTVKPDRRTTASLLFGMLVSLLAACAVWPKPEPEELIVLPSIAEVQMPIAAEIKDSASFPNALPLPYCRDQIVSIEP